VAGVAVGEVCAGPEVAGAVLGAICFAR